jgi:hypothetical protein
MIDFNDISLPIENRRICDATRFARTDRTTGVGADHDVPGGQEAPGQVPDRRCAGQSRRQPRGGARPATRPDCGRIAPTATVATSCTDRGHLGSTSMRDFPRVLDAAADLLGRARSAPVRKASKEARRRRSRPRHRQVGLPRCHRQTDRGRLPLRPARAGRRSSGPGMPSGARWPRPTRVRSTTSRGWCR